MKHLIKFDTFNEELTTGFSNAAYKKAYYKNTEDPFLKQKSKQQSYTFGKYINPIIKKECEKENCSIEIVNFDTLCMKLCLFKDADDIQKYNDSDDVVKYKNLSFLPLLTIEIEENSYQIVKGDISSIPPNKVRTLPKLIKKIQDDIKSPKK